MEMPMRRVKKRSAAWGVPVLFGPDMSDFPDASRDLIESNAALRITDELELTGALRKLSADPALRARMGASGRRLVELNRGTTARVADLAAVRLSEKRDQRT